MDKTGLLLDYIGHFVKIGILTTMCAGYFDIGGVGVDKFSLQMASCCFSYRLLGSVCRYFSYSASVVIRQTP